MTEIDIKTKTFGDDIGCRFEVAKLLIRELNRMNDKLKLKCLALESKNSNMTKILNLLDFVVCANCESWSDDVIACEYCGADYCTNCQTNMKILCDELKCKYIHFCNSCASKLITIKCSICNGEYIDY